MDIYIGKKLRMRRLFRRGRAIIAAVDHGSYWGHISGLEKPVEVIGRLAETEVDGIAATPQVIARAADVLGDLAVVARVDSSVAVYDRDMEDDRPITTIEHIVRLGADGALAMLYLGGPRSSDQQEKIGRIATDCFRYGIPLIVEALPYGVVDYHFDRGTAREKPLASYISLRDLMAASRIAAELGADAVKTYFLGPVHEYRRVVENALVPILVLGGPRAETTRDFLEIVRMAMDAGAKGVVVGRNLWQQEDPSSLAKALSLIVHDDRGVEEALRVVRGR